MRRLVAVSCPACGHHELDVFFEEQGIPTNSCLLLDTLDEARTFPTGDMELGFCLRCGFLANIAFREAEYSARYEETQGFSALFVEWGRKLAQRWVEKYNLQGRSVLEVGCGKGEFLTWMVEAGAGRGVGIDPGVHPERIQTDVEDRLTWIADFYSEKYADLAADAVVCRHTLEHIAPVRDFMTMVRRAIGDRLDTIVLFELPDVKRVLEEVAFWDVYHEHCSYFSLGSLARLFRRTGFEVLHLELDYDDQYLLIEACPSPSLPAQGEPFQVEDDLELLRNGVQKYHTEVRALRESWRARLADLRASGGTAVIWGAGSKGVSFLTNLGLSDEIEFAVDINPFKTGKFMAGTGHQIVAPEFLREYRPDLVIAMNPIYLDEIRQKLDDLGLKPDLIAA
jgi:SAM-dependent methyltransferase